MVGFYHGTIIPGNDANEGIYFIKQGTAYSIYTKVNGKAPELYAEANDVTAATIEELWGRIGDTFVQKTFTIAGIDLQDNIPVSELVEALELKSLAYKDSATGTLEDYVTEVVGIDYTPTGKVEINLGYENTQIVSSGTFIPTGTISGEFTPEGHIQLNQDDKGFAISGTITKPIATVDATTTIINQISDVGTLPTYTPAQYVAPSVSETKVPFATAGMTAAIDSSNNSLLVFTNVNTVEALTGIGFNQGSYTPAVFNPGSLPTIDNTLSVVSSINGVDVSTPEFIGDKISATFIGTTSDINAEFKGETETITVSGNYDKAIVNSATFTGDEQTITPTLTKENKTITVQ